MFFFTKKKLHILFSLNSQMQFPVVMQNLFAANTSTYFALFQKFCDHRGEVADYVKGFSHDGHDLSVN